MSGHHASLLTCSLFQGMDPAIVEKILAQSETKVYANGQCLINKGDVPSALFIIAKGKAGIYNEDVLLAELGPQSVMGESFLANASATATIIAAEELTTVEIRKELFYELVTKYPQLVLNLFTVNHQRLRSSNENALREARAREEKLEKLVKERTRELEEANHELSITRDNLIETQKFRDQFLANMSHEIRTPMNAIVGLTNLLLKSPLNELQDKYLKVIKKSGANLLVIINDILDLAKIEAGKMELESVPFPLVNAIRNVHTILNLKAEEKGIGMVEIIAPEVPEYVYGDETRITQVVMNLAGNAIKFTEKGKVTIGVSVTSHSNDDYQIRFSVTDTGIGIPADKIDTIFESFGQASSDTTRKFGGTGLGLTISRQLVEMHGGQLQVSSTPNVGSEFYFTLTYKAAAAPQEAGGDDEGSKADMTGVKILLVEDNEFNQMVAVDTLKDIFPELEVDIAPDGTTAVDKASGNDYRMVLMDIHLPDFDGYETTRRIRKATDEKRRNVPICAMTASVTKENIDECFEAGMNDYMMKPFSPDVLREKIIRNTMISA